MVRIALIGDRSEAVTAHRAIDACFRMIAGVEGVWMHTSAIGDLSCVQGIWCVPASPYADTEAALRAIRFARENRVPFLGTCGGFQHAIVEYVRNVLGLKDADHAENNPEASMPVIAPLECALVEKSGAIVLSSGRIQDAYRGAAQIEEGYHCSYGFNPAYVDLLFEKGDLVATAYDLEGAIRGVELHGHPFFVATLFQPERLALRGEVPPLMEAFVAACGVN
jgi:CTP synthase (UTP-ammonia lyase)